MTDHLAGIHAELALRRLIPELENLRSQCSVAKDALEQKQAYVRRIEIDLAHDTTPPREKWPYFCGLPFMVLVGAVLISVSSSNIWRLCVIVGWTIWLTVALVADHRDHVAKAQHRKGSRDHLRQALLDAQRLLPQLEREHARLSGLLKLKSDEVARVKSLLPFRS